MKELAGKFALLAAFAGSTALNGLMLMVALALLILPTIPDVGDVSEISLKVPLRVYTEDGMLIAEYGDERREPIDHEMVPQDLKNAILAAEDDEFYGHSGVDFSGIFRAAIANFRSGGRSQGASTITMQVARNYFLSREKTYTRKLREMFMAFRLEQALSKDEILELYVNKIFLGHRAYGFAAASSVYYNSSLEDLELPQFAMLAGLPKAPSRNNPLTNPENATNRRNYVLGRMLTLGMIDSNRHDFAVEAPITAARYVAKVDFDAPYIGEMVRQIMVDQFSEEVYGLGYNVYTTVKSDLQQSAQESVRNGLIAYDRRHGFRGPVGNIEIDADESAIRDALASYPASGELHPAVVIKVHKNSFEANVKNLEKITIGKDGYAWARRHKTAELVGGEPKRAGNIVKPGDVVYVTPSDSGWSLSQIPEIAGALVAIDPDDGAIKALIGGFDYYLSKFNRATQAERQPGSNIKPFIYSAALEKSFTPTTLISGAPIVIEQDDIGNIWRPENYSGKIFGPTPMRRALSLSLNLVSVRILRSIGPDFALKHIEKFGFDRDRLPRGLALALGAAQLTPLEVVAGYAVFANGGYLVEPYLISRIEDSTGSIIARANPTTVCENCPPDSFIGDASQANTQAVRVLSPENAYIMTSLLQQVVRTGTARKALVLGRDDLAGKTGTTNEFRDAWFSGFNRRLTASVRVGFDEVANMGRGEAGSRAALPIWIEFMKTALRDVPESSLPIPDSVVQRTVSLESGEVLAQDDPAGIIEYFMFGTEPDALAISVELEPEITGEPKAKQTTEGLF